MVGYAVRKGARGRGGRRFQVLAAALTYASVALAYAPIAVKQAIDADRRVQSSAVTGNAPAAAADGTRSRAERAGGGRFLQTLVSLLALIAVLPVLVVVGSFPSGLIS